MTSKETQKTMQACWKKGHRRAAMSMGGGTGRMGSRWQWLSPISTTEGGLRMATGPPYINSIQGDALSSHQCDMFLTTPPPLYPSSQYWRCWINHVVTYNIVLKSRVGPIACSLKMESMWGNIFFKIIWNKIRWGGMTCLTLLMVDYEWGSISEQLVWEITFRHIPGLSSPCSLSVWRAVKSMYWIGAN